MLYFVGITREGSSLLQYYSFKGHFKEPFFFIFIEEEKKLLVLVKELREHRYETEYQMSMETP